MNETTKTDATAIADSDMLTTGFIDDAILDQAIQTWGVDAQVEMLLEECIELSLAIQKLKRLRGDKQQKFDNLIDELADVKIMMRQAEKIFPLELINLRVDFKMNRLKERLSERVP